MTNICLHGPYKSSIVDLSGKHGSNLLVLTITAGDTRVSLYFSSEDELMDFTRSLSHQEEGVLRERSNQND